MIEAKKSTDSSVRSSNSSLQASSTECLNAQSSDTLLQNETDKSDLDTTRNDTDTKQPTESKMDQLYNNLLNENSKYYTKLTNHTLNVRTQSSASSVGRRTSAKERKQTIDTQKKTKLLAALKAIDSNQSFEN